MNEVNKSHAARRWALLGTLLLAAVQSQAQAPSNPYSYARTSSFTYYASGVLQSETVEPDIPGQCVTTSYTYDTWGNKTGATTSNCAGASGRAVFTARSSSSTYGAFSVNVPGASGTVSVAVPAGQYPTSASNALSQTETRVIDPRFGAVVSLTGPNGLTTTVGYDDFGRKILETRADGTSTVTRYCVLASVGAFPGQDTSSNSAGCTDAALSGQAGEVPALAVSYIQSVSLDTAGQAMGPAGRAYKDAQGRTIREVAESFDGASQPGDRRWVVKDTTYNAYGVAWLTTAPYFLGKDSSTVAGNADLGLSKTTVDALGRPIRIDVADPQGNAAGVDFGGRSRTSAVTLVVYSELVTTTTNPKGQTRKEEKNIDGKLVRVTDAYGAQVAHQHDAFGNLIQTQDALGNLLKLSYDTRGRKLGMTDPDTGAWAYDYNALGELVWQQSPTQAAATPPTVTTMAYDVLGRLTSRVEPEYTSSWYYDTYAGGAACNKGIGKLCESSTSHGVNKKIAYDNLGRPSSSRTTITSGPSFASAITYEASTGRPLKQTYPTGVAVQYAYTARGYLAQVTLATAATISPLPATPGGSPVAGKSLAAGTALWTAGTVNAWGKAETQSVDSGVISRASYEPNTGRAGSLSAGIGAATNVFSHAYTWDSLGNLLSRIDNNGDGNTGAVSENYSYDAINRLTRYTVAAPQVPNLQRTVDLVYNAIGNLLYKSDVGNYEYPQYGNSGGTSNPQPHAVSRIVGTSFGTVGYSYDSAGNLISATGGKYRSISYTSFNLPDSNQGAAGPGGSPRYTWQYDESHQRIKETRQTASGTRSTWYQHPDNQGGLSFESEQGPSGSTSNRHYISAGSMTIVLVSTGALQTLPAGQLTPPAISSVTLVKLEVWHKDHLGSIAATTDHQGNVTARYAYDPFGKRRYTSGTYDAFGALVIDWADNVNQGTDRGYTGHEHLDDIGLIHMNGRIFDPVIARFLQADPFIQDPQNLQNYNRYTYCFNSPLVCTDPSGYFSLKKFLRVAAVVAVSCLTGTAAAGWAQSSAWVGLFGSGAGIAAGAAGGAIIGFSSAVINGSSFSAAVHGGLQGAFSGAVFAGVGDYINNTGAFKDGLNNFGDYSVPRFMESSWQGVTLHGIAGCVTSAAAGGKCGAGALSASFSQAALDYKNDFGKAIGNQVLGGVVSSAVIGGTASVLGGGKFANGAQTAAFGYLFNHWAHSAQLAAYGREAHGLLQDYMEERGYVVESKCATPTNCVDGRFDIASAQTKEVWEIKRNSWFGLAMGELALEAYTAPETGLRRGGNLIGLKVGSELSLWKGDIEYRYTNYGDGSIGYSRYDHTPKQPIRIYVPKVGPVPGGSRGGRDQFGF